MAINSSDEVLLIILNKILLILLIKVLLILFYDVSYMKHCQYCFTKYCKCRVTKYLLVLFKFQPLLCSLFRLRREGQKTPEPEFKNPQVSSLFHKWRQVWLLAMDRRRKLQDALDRQNEVSC